MWYFKIGVICVVSQFVLGIVFGMLEGKGKLKKTESVFDEVQSGKTTWTKEFTNFVLSTLLSFVGWPITMPLVAQILYDKYRK